MIRVIKKDNTKEEFNVQKVVNAVNKSATRVMYEFTPTEIEYICSYVTEKARGRAPRGREKLPRLPQLQAGLCKHAGRGVQEEPVHHVHR